MTHKLILAGMILSATALLAERRASAGFVSATAAGPGGTASGLQVATVFAANDDVEFNTVYTSAASIVFTLTVDGPGEYFLGALNGSVTNSTAGLFPSFSADLVGAPVGTTFDGGGYNSNVFSNGTSLNPPYPNSTNETFNGPPGLAAGETTQLYVSFAVSATGTQTFQIDLTPGSAVPEPSSLALCGIAGVAGTVVARLRRKHAA